MGKKTEKHIIERNTGQRIIHHIILRSGYLTSLGLLDGKMGIAVFFACLAKNTGISLYEDIAGELIDDIWEEDLSTLPLGLGSGLSGMGLGIEYLIQEGFVEGDSSEVCGDLDMKIMEKDPRRITDFSPENGIEGMLHYILAHIRGCMEKEQKIPFDEIYLNDLHYALNKLSKDDLNNKLLELITLYNDFCRSRTIPAYRFDLKAFISFPEFNEDKLLAYPVGLNKGLCGFLLKQMNIIV
ncbi:MAG: hypothetical protein LBT43_09380 [Prevotella sp.]|jgi:hypothetical protein|nr:hypothetical protein [Prevotella sp.]